MLFSSLPEPGKATCWKPTVRTAAAYRDPLCLCQRQCHEGRLFVSSPPPSPYLHALVITDTDSPPVQLPSSSKLSSSLICSHFQRLFKLQTPFIPPCFIKIEHILPYFTQYSSHLIKLGRKMCKFIWVRLYRSRKHLLSFFVVALHVISKPEIFAKIYSKVCKHTTLFEIPRSYLQNTFSSIVCVLKEFC